jgi:D-alanyl-lipoteichoic acid acyltransferase DltB (MBOAT superfamily)
MAWDWRFIGLILFSTVLDYGVGLALGRTEKPALRRWLLAASVVGNLAVLGLFKYHDFFAESLNALFGRFGIDLSLPLLHLILPVGISFYTFQTLSYTIDVYRGLLEPRRSFVQFALFVAFFPQLVAGPIVRAREFLPQLDEPRRYTAESTSSGIYLILKGLTKKVLLADVIGHYLVNPVWAKPESHPGLWVALAFYGFTFQIYCDFSGYTDIARGCGRLLGFELPINFRSPFKAPTFTNYWSRWHITLGSWFRDYVYYPLGGSRRGLWRANLYVFITFLLVGLWHGAAWTFVIWGACHATLLIIERTYRALGPQREPNPRLLPLKVLLRFQISALLTGAIFRAPSFAALSELRDAAISPSLGLATIPWAVWLAFGLAVVTHFLPEQWKDGAQGLFSRSPALVQAAAIVVVITLIRYVGTTVEPFYYFQF